MGEQFDFERSLRHSEADLVRPDRPSTFRMCGRQWDLLDGVFAPLYRPSTRASLDFLGLTAPAGHRVPDSMLEMGSGTGIVAVMAALAGCRRVVAADINPRAVDNTRANAERHGVGDRVGVVHSDLFRDVPDERFDLVFWNSPFILAPEDHVYGSLHERAFVDAGYAAHRRFFEDVPARLTDRGAALLLLSSTKGDMRRLEEIAAACGRRLLVRGARTYQDGSDAPEAEYLLTEVARSDRAPLSADDPVPRGT